MPDPALEIKVEGGGGTGLPKKFFRPFGPQFGPKIRRGPGPATSSSGSATGLYPDSKKKGKTVVVCSRPPEKVVLTSFPCCCNLEILPHSLPLFPSKYFPYFCALSPLLTNFKADLLLSRIHIETITRRPYINTNGSF